jgi:uncharacterized membrane protein
LGGRARCGRWFWPATLLAGGALALGAFAVLPVLAYRVIGHHGPAGGLPTTDLTYRDIRPIIVARCVMCHSEHPSNPAYATAPAGLRLDTYDDVVITAYQVMPLSVHSKIMPPGNGTGMTQDERAKLGAWLAAGAPQ